MYVHHRLEGSSDVHQAERNLSIHEHSPWCCKSCLFPVIRVYHDLIITRKTIQHGNLLGPHHLLQDIVHFRKRLVILEGHFVQILEVYT